jgi:hypothetical protein
MRTKTTKKQLWGCDPGFVCNVPKPQGCNLFAEPPSSEFLCEPKYCIRAPPLYRANWRENETGYFPPTEGYFNLNPNAFGLSYDIFELHEVVTKIDGKKTTITTGNWVSQTDLTHFPPEPTSVTTTQGHYGRGLSSHRLSKRDESVAPAVCYGICNEAFNEGQRVGLIPELCNVDATFRTLSDNCITCIQSNKDNVLDTIRVHVGPEFEDMWNFCEIKVPEPQETVTSAQSQVTSTPDVVTSTQDGPNTNTDPIPITPTSTSTSTSEPEPEPTPTETIPSTSTEAEPTPTDDDSTTTPSSTSTPPVEETSTSPVEETSTSTDPEPTPTDSSSSTTSTDDDSNTGSPTPTDDDGDGSDPEPTPSESSSGLGSVITPPVTGTGTTTLQTSTTTRASTSTVVTGAAGRVRGGVVGSFVVALLGAIVLL